LYEANIIRKILQIKEMEIEYNGRRNFETPPDME
jgi:hypothetical protein